MMTEVNTGKILIVDDEKVVCMGFERVLAEAGYEVDSAMNGSEAIAKAKEKDYDIAFIDLILPAMNGVEVCRAIKKIKPEMTLIFMTGKLDTDPIGREVEFVEAGGKTYSFYKPFGAEEILEVTRKAISER
ncbi:MAG: response regulator [Candidatus Omnitrophota bacterium]|nr:response regulator [Candidatus Omnitrophota bacterium]